MVNCRLACNIKRKGCLTHTRACGKDDEVRLLETSQHIVEVFKSGAYAAYLIFMLMQVLKPCPCFFKRLAKCHKLRERWHGGNFIDLLLRLIQRLIQIFAFIKSKLSDIFTGANELAEHVLFLHLSCVVAGIACCGHISCKLLKIGGTTNLFKLSEVGELCAHRLNIYRLSFVIERKGSAVYDSMLFCIERIFGDDVGCLDHRLGTNHECA